MKNKDLRRSFTVNSLRLLRPDGVSEDGCNLPEWLHGYLNNSNTLTRCPEASLTSPACVEGKARALHLTRLTAGGQNMTLNSSAGTGWYGNVPLPADGRALTVAASFESGAHTLSSQISWEACDILTHSQMTLRKGDSLRLQVGTGETAPAVKVTYKKGEVETVSEQNQALPMLFDQPGVYTVTASWEVPAETPETGSGTESGGATGEPTPGQAVTKTASV